MRFTRPWRRAAAETTASTAQDRTGALVSVIDHAAGEPVSAKAVRDELAKHAKVKAVAVVHAETSTGVLVSDPEAILGGRAPTGNGELSCSATGVLSGGALFENVSCQYDGPSHVLPRVSFVLLFRDANRAGGCRLRLLGSSPSARAPFVRAR